MNYFTADLHFDHKNIMTYDSRPFSTVDEMNKIIIDNWNSTVKDDDDIWIVGDISLGNATRFLKQLKGRKHLIIGNHDHQTLKDPEARKCFVSIDSYKTIYDNNRKIVLFHYPIAEWDGFYHGTILIYGHIHSSINETIRFMKTRPNAYNAGCMINNYKPVTLDELIANNEKFLSSIGEE